MIVEKFTDAIRTALGDGYIFNFVADSDTEYPIDENGFIVPAIDTVIVAAIDSVEL